MLVFGAVWHEGFVYVDPLSTPMSLLFVHHGRTGSIYREVIFLMPCVKQ